jgi:hypothetical protein
MIRKGIPAPLRCAVWLSNIVQSSHPDQDLAISHEYRTLAKVAVVDGLYDSLWEQDGTVESGSKSNTNTAATAATSIRISRRDVTRISFGNDAIWATLLGGGGADGDGDDEQKNGVGCPGIDALERVLYALHKCVMGGIVDYAPLLPTLAATLLGFMGESYAFYACREMYHHSTWYWATSRAEYVATHRAFADVLQRLHPQTYATMRDQEAVRPYCRAIFQDFFSSVLPEWMVYRMMDMYSLEGGKVLFRFGVALAVLYGTEYKERYMYESTEPNKWWLGLVAYCHDTTSGDGLNFDVWIKKAYGVHGRGMRKRYRFPRRPILARIIEVEEESYRREQLEKHTGTMDGHRDSVLGGAIHDTWDARDDSYKETDFYLQVEPLGLVQPPPPDDPREEPVVARLASPTLVRALLAEWMPLSLRFTKLDLVYSTSHHGRTLESLYRNVSQSTHTVLILEPYDASLGGKKVLIGMYASHPWRPSRRVYGDGRCFLFRIVLDDGDEDDDKKGRHADSGGGGKVDGDPPASKCWKWRPPDLLDFTVTSLSDDDGRTSPSNGSYSTKQASSAALLETFQISTNDFLSMGGSEHGGAGLRLNEDLTKGESTTAAGFENEPLLPGGGGMFEVGLVEVYRLVRQMDGVPIQ